MTATGHAIIGVSLAALIPNPIIGIPVAILSHIPCDLFPHWDSGTARIKKRKKSDTRFLLEAILDTLLSYTLTYFIATTFFPQVSIFYVFSMAIGAQLLDYFSMGYYIFHITLWPFKMVYNWQRKWNITLDAPWG